MNYRSESQAYLDDAGRLVIPAEVMVEYGLKPGSQIRIEKKAVGLWAQGVIQCP
jgi:bifunctional DNA-binding transcriptional regulator/antitoxin component of YhaV-PrlF toxin-antitoxin module